MQKNQKNIVLGITGGIAAYKTPELVRQLRRQGHNVQVVLSHAAREFVAPLALQAVSGCAVRTDLFDPAAEAAMGHIELARWADLILIAPATADVIARLAHGNANDLLTTLCLATESPVVIAPAMNRVMWHHPATETNILMLQARGVHVWGPDSGAQACGEVGLGRMLEPEAIAEQVDLFWSNGLLAGVNVMITAGPTREAIDPVRFISNRSSGKMGYALARACRQAGANVTLVTGPSHEPIPPQVTILQVEDAHEMHTAVMDDIEKMDIFIATAAVADYKPKNFQGQKIKKSGQILNLELAPTRDILREVAEQAKVFTVGFAAETQNVRQYALQKLQNKKLNMIAANDVSNGLAFDKNENALLVLWREGEGQGEQILPSMSKLDLANKLVELIAGRYFATFL